MEKKGDRKKREISKISKESKEEEKPLLDDSSLGEVIEPTKEFQWASSSYHLTYKGHIPFEKLMEKLSSFRGSTPLLRYSFVHETSDSSHAYDHTHFYFTLEKRVRKRGFCFTFGSPGSEDYLHPNVQVVSYTKHHNAIYDYHKKSPVGDSLRQFGQETIKSRKDDGKQFWADVTSLAANGKMNEIQRKHPDFFARNYRFLQEVAAKGGDFDIPEVKPLSSLENIFLFGPPGTGKSTFLRDYAAKHYPDYQIFRPTKNLRYWNGYHHQEIVLIDELEPVDTEHSAGLYKELLDVFPFTVDVKFSPAITIRPKVVLLASNHSIEELFPKAAEAISCRLVIRKLTKVFGEKKTINSEVASLLDADLAGL